MKQKTVITLSDVPVGKIVEINGYDYTYIGRMFGKEKQIIGMGCFVYVSDFLKEKKQPYEKWFIASKTYNRELKKEKGKLIF